MAINAAVGRIIFGKEVVTTKTSFYDLEDRDMQGNQISMSSFEDNVLLVVNVASN